MPMELRKAIMPRSKLKSIANKSKSDEFKRRYKDQRNIVVKPNNQAKRNFFNSLQ